MRRLIFLLMTVAVLLSGGCSKKKAVFNETRQSDFYLRNGVVFFQRAYDRNISFEAAANEWKSRNNPVGGIQVKNIDNDVMNGVLVQYQVDWQMGETKKLKVPEDMKNPVNASFTVEKTAGSYTITVRDIWFSDRVDIKKQSNLRFENFVLQKNGYSFKKDKATLKLTSHLSRELSLMFDWHGTGYENKF